MIRRDFGAVVGLIAALCLTPANADEGDSGRYVGAIVCKTCHGPTEAGSMSDPFTMWSVSKHSRTWVQLGTGYVQMIDPEAKGLVPEGFGGSILKEADRLGIDQNCLLCHTTALEVDAALKAETFHLEDGVQCEACHGPGGAHAAWMQENGNAAARPASAHMRVGTLQDCLDACHRAKPTHEPFIGTSFNVEKAWKHIKH